MYCKKCGNKIGEQVYCEKCGEKVEIIKSTTETNIFSVIGFIVSVISIFINLWGLVGIAAVVLSTIGLLKIKESGEKGKEFAIIGISIGVFSIFYAFIVLVLFSY